MTQSFYNNYAFRTKWIDEEEKHCVTLCCNGEELETQKFDGHQDMMNWISDTMAGLQLCGENWTFAESDNQAKEFDAKKTLNDLRSLKKNILEKIHQNISDGKFYDLSTPMVIHFIDGDCSSKMVCTGVGNDSHGVLTFISKGDDGSDYYDVGDELIQYDIESLLAVLEAVKTEVRKVRIGYIRNWLVLAGCKKGYNGLELDGEFCLESGESAAYICIGEEGDVLVSLKDGDGDPIPTSLDDMKISEEDFARFESYFERDHTRKNIVVEILQMMKQYGIKNWVMDYEFSSDEKLKVLDYGDEHKCGVHSLWTSDWTTLCGQIEYFERAENATNSFFTDHLSYASLVLLRDQLRYEMRTYFTDKTSDWLKRNGGLDSTISLDKTFEYNGMKIFNIYVMDDGSIEMGAEDVNKDYKYIRITDFNDKEFEEFFEYLRNQRFFQFEIKESKNHLDITFPITTGEPIFVVVNTSEYDGGMGVQICNGYEEAGKTGWTKDIIGDLQIGCVLEDNHYGKSATIQRVA